MESIQLTALSELDAVNNIIGTIGEAPINTLDDMTDVDAINALRILRDVSRQEQSRGWTFNKIPHFTLVPDEDTNKIYWNDDFLYMKDNHGLKLVKSGEFVKDLFRNNTVFKHPLDVQLVIYLPFESLPEQMRNYILAKACFLFQARYFGDDSLAKITQGQIQEAWQHLQEFEIDNNNFTMLDHTYVRKLRMR